MKTYQGILTVSVAVTSSTVKHRFIGFEGALCVAAAKSLGVSELDVTVASGTGYLPVVAAGIGLVELGASVAVGAALEASGTAGDAGMAITKSSGVINGYAMDAGDAGDIIRVKLV